MGKTVKKHFEWVVTRLKDNSWNKWDVSKFISEKSQYMHCNYRLQHSHSIHDFCYELNKILDKHLYPNDFMFKLLIKEFGKVNLQYALQLNQIAIDHNLDTPYTYFSILGLILRKPIPDTNLAMELYNQAKERNKLSAFVFARTCEILSKSSYPDGQLVVRLFNEAEDLNMADCYIFSSTLLAVSRTSEPQTEVIIDLLTKAEYYGWDNDINCCCALNGIARSNKPDLPYMMRILEKLQSREEDCSLAYISIIDALVKQKQLKEAETLFTTAVNDGSLKFPTARKRGGQWIVNLHGYSYGTAYIGLSKLLTEFPSHRLSIICGQNSHLKLYKNNAESVVRLAVIRALSEKERAYTPRKGNIGIFDIEPLKARVQYSIQPKKTYPKRFFVKIDSTKSVKQTESETCKLSGLIQQL